MNYYIENENGIVIYSTNRAEVENTVNKCFPEYVELPIKKTRKNIVEFNNAYYLEDDENYIAMRDAAEAARIEALYMTRSDFFDGTIKAWGADSADLLLVIEGLMGSLPISEIEKKIALNNYRNALNFYRRHTLFTLLSNVPITIGGVQVVVTSEQWDRFFDETSKRNPDAYKELLPPSPEPTAEPEE